MTVSVVLHTHVVEDDVAPIPLHWGHAPGKEAALEDEIDWEGISQRVYQEVQE